MTKKVTGVPPSLAAIARHSVFSWMCPHRQHAGCTRRRPVQSNHPQHGTSTRYTHHRELRCRCCRSQFETPNPIHQSTTALHRCQSNPRSCSPCRSEFPPAGGRRHISWHRTSTPREVRSDRRRRSQWSQVARRSRCRPELIGTQTTRSRPEPRRLTTAQGARLPIGFQSDQSRVAYPAPFTTWNPSSS
jgi:hypothetical protein